MQLFQWRRVLQNYVFAFHFNESVEVFNPFALVTISKNAWRIVNTCFYQVTKRVKWDNFALRRRKSFFKWFNYADSGAIIIRYISLQQQQNELFSLKRENFAEFIVQQKLLNCGSKWQYAITKLFKLVSGFVLS